MTFSDDPPTSLLRRCLRSFDRPATRRQLPEPPSWRLPSRHRPTDAPTARRPSPPASDSQAGTVATVTPARVSIHLGLLLAALLTGCSTAPPGAPLHARPAASDSAPASPVCPLRGSSAPPEAHDRPVLAVKIENSPQARPQAGLEAADLVYEEPVEGGSAWLLALFQCSDPPEAGPVRAAHLADPEILRQHRPVAFVHAGGPPEVLERIAATPGLQGLDALRASTGFGRQPGRRPPHNLFAAVPDLRAAVGARGAPSPLSFLRAPGVSSAAASSPTHRPGTSVLFSFGAEPVRWAWSEPAGAYLRFQGAAPHTTGGGGQVQAANVAVLWVSVLPGALSDEAGNPSPQLELEGRGDALVLQGGAEREGRWERESRDARFRLTDRKGKPIELVPGTTWIELLPKDRPAYVR